MGRLYEDVGEEGAADRPREGAAPRAEEQSPDRRRPGPSAPGGQPSRRALLATLGGGLATTVAGCTGLDSGPEENEGGSDDELGPAGSAEDPTPAPPEGVTLERAENLSYRHVGGRQLRLDLLRPADDVLRPLVVHVHGGGWRRGSRGYEHAEHLARAGFGVASVGYRTSQEAAFPAAVRDVAAAVKWLRWTAASHRFDDERIALLGESAGGHLASLVATAPGHDRFEPGTYLRGVPARVQALVSISGIYDLRLEPRCTADVTEDFLGGTCEERPERARVASPVVHVDEATPPTKVLHGWDDEVVTVRQALELRDELRAADVAHDLFTPVEGEHLLEERQTAVLHQQLEFLADWLHVERVARRGNPGAP